jgi:hypothetical protein
LRKFHQPGTRAALAAAIAASSAAALRALDSLEACLLQARHSLERSFAPKADAGCSFLQRVHVSGGRTGAALGSASSSPVSCCSPSDSLSLLLLLLLPSSSSSLLLLPSLSSSLLLLLLSSLWLSSSLLLRCRLRAGLPVLPMDSDMLPCWTAGVAMTSSSAMSSDMVVRTCGWGWQGGGRRGGEWEGGIIY